MSLKLNLYEQGCDTVSVMRKNKALFYIKEDLRKFKTEDIHLNSHEVDMDYMALKTWKTTEREHRSALLI